MAEIARPSLALQLKADRQVGRWVRSLKLAGAGPQTVSRPNDN
jgi:hypothetical protein